MNWSTSCWQRIKPIYDAILELPFLKGLMDGTLEREKFIFYIQQDALYLAQYGKVLAGIASKLEQPQFSETFIGFAKESMAVERALHKQFAGSMGGAELHASPSCMLYTSYLMAQLSSGSVEKMVAAVLPCFWIYQAVGEHILAYQTPRENPYQMWIDTYGGEEFNQGVQKAIAICNQLAERSSVEQREEMSEAFVMCSKMEWLFWESAWRMEQWPL